MRGVYALTFMYYVSLGTDEEDYHLQKLDTLLSKLWNADIRLKLSKYHFCQRSVVVLGHLVDSEGLHPSAGHLSMIHELTMPSSGEKLLRFLLLSKCFAAFIDHFAPTAKPLYDKLEGSGFSVKRRHGQRFIMTDLK